MTDDQDPIDDSELPSALDGALDRGLERAFGENAAQGYSPSVIQRIGELSGAVPSVSLREVDAVGNTPILKPLVAEDGVAREAGKYMVHGLLGQGGVGSVHRGHDTDLGRDVAMKFLHDKYRSEPGILHRFVEEAQIGGQLQHPGIVPVYELGMADGRPFFAMKMVKGQTLAKKLADRASPADDRRTFLSIFEDICQTMAYAHARGVVHRDLKPANIMIGGFGEVQVVDWGMGKVLQSGGVADEKLAARRQSQLSVIETVRSAGHGTQSVMGSVMGTPAYMPPEQARGDVEAMDERSDVFALGAILCELLTGMPPYVGEPAELIGMAAMAKLDDAHRRLNECGADTDLIELATRCLMPAPAARPASAKAVADAIHTHLAAAEARVHEARVEAAEARVRATALKRQRTLGLALTATVVAGLAFSLWLWRDADEQRRLAERQRRIAEEQRDQVALIANFMTETLAGAKPSVAQGRDTTMLAEMMDSAARRLEAGELEASPVAQNELRRTIARTYREIDRGARARAILEPVVALSRRALEEPDGQPPLTHFHTLKDYAFLLSMGGTHEDRQLAVVLSREALQFLEREAEVSQATLAGAHNSLATSLRLAGRLPEAIGHATEAVEINRALYAGDHVDLANTLHNLAVCRSEQGDTEAAKELFVEAVDMKRRLYPSGHPDLLHSIIELTAILESQRKYAEATALDREGLEFARKLYSRPHYHTALFLQRIADYEWFVGDRKGALPLIREAVEIHEQVGASVSTGTRAVCHWRLTRSLIDAGVLAEAEAVARKAHALAEGSVDLPNQLQIAITLADVLYLREAWGEVEEVSREILELVERLPEPDPTTLVGERFRLARALFAQGRESFDEAANVLQDARSLAGRTPGGGLPPMLRVRIAHLHATVLDALGRTDAATAAAREALASARRSLPIDNPELTASRESLVALLHKQQAWAEAETLLRDICRRMTDAATPSAGLGKVRNDLAIVLREAGKLDEAETMFRELVEDTKRLHGDRSDATARAHLGLGKTLLAREDFAAAEREILAAAGILGEATPLHDDCVQHLVTLYSAWDAAEPGKGYGSKAAEWREKLGERR